ncbi:MAG TPA: Ig-like domain-containing protein [Symbiobacteriaceae bacterium]|nr:Ig-like domain-containing protein [Symbiobacteriaceae bacterium]
MKRSGWPLVRRSAGVMLSALLLGESLAIPGAKAAPVASIKQTLVSDSAAWMRAAHSVSGVSVSLDFGTRFPAQFQPAAVSSSLPAVATAALSGAQVLVTVQKEGTAEITVEAVDQDQVRMTDRFEVKVVRVGDADGDGVLTTADAQYVQQVVKGVIVATPEQLKRLDVDGDGQVTAADAAKVMNLYVSHKKGTLPVEYDVALADIGDAPVARQVLVTGTAQYQGTLTGSYAYLDVEGDAEGATTMQWYRGASPDGSDKAAIAGADGATYTVQAADGGQYLFLGVTPAASSGNSTGAPTFSLATAQVPVPDLTPPVPVRLWPEDNATDVEPGPLLSLTFDEPIRYFAGRRISIYPAGGGPAVVSYQIAYLGPVTAEDRTATVTVPATELQSGMTYYVEVEPNAFSDQSFNFFGGIAGPTAWNFTMRDTVAPTLSATAPADGTTRVAPNAEIKVTFSENVRAAPDKSVAILVEGTGDPVIYSADDPSNVSINGAEVTFRNPGLALGLAHFVQVDAGAFTDLSGNPIASATWSFVTRSEVQAPALTAILPAHEATGVAVGAPLSMTFDEDVIPVAGKFLSVHRSGDDQTAFRYEATDPRVNVSGSTVTLTNPGLAGGAGYYVTVEPGAFTDAAGNEVAGESGTNWSFTTKVPVAISAALEEGVPGLNEVNLEAGVIILTPTGAAFRADASDADFTLNNPPPGTSIGLATVIDGQAWLVLTHDGSDFDADVTGLTVTAKVSAFERDGEQVTSNSLTVTAVVEQPSVFISELVDAGNQKFALELYNPTAGPVSGVEVEVHQWVTTLSPARMVISKQPLLLPINPGVAQIPVMSGHFYEGMDVLPMPNGAYIIDLTHYATPINAIVLKKDGQVIDVIGYPSTYAQRPILSAGGTLVRRSDVPGGSTVYRANQYTQYDRGTYGFFGTHVKQ